MLQINFAMFAVVAALLCGSADHRAAEVSRINANASIPWTAGASARFPAGLDQTALSAELSPLLGSAGNRTERKDKLRARARAGTIGFVPRDPVAGDAIPAS